MSRILYINFQFLFNPLICPPLVIGVNALQTLGGPPRSFSTPSSLPLPAPSPSPFLTPFPLLLPLTQLRGLGERCKLPQRVGRSPATKRILVHLEAKMKCFGGQISRIFNEQNLNVLL